MQTSVKLRLTIAVFSLQIAVLGGEAPSRAVLLPEVTVYSPRVAIQEPAATFAMPVSALRYEPLIDVQARNLTEAQADVSIRGGIFENTGFRIGGSTLYDPQTGHYFAEIPVAPAMLGAPSVLTGVASASSSTNATTGTVAYGWRPIRTSGFASAAAGGFATQHEEIYLGGNSGQSVFGARFAADADVAHSESDGSLPFGDSHFDRANLRLQFAHEHAQTDLFIGYQAKFFGWANLYTPFNSPESENLQTTLTALNHRADLSGGDFLQLSAYRRRNKDDYAFNRLAAVGAVHPFQHTTTVNEIAAEGRNTLDAAGLALVWRGEILADKLKSTSLTFGPYSDRTLAKFYLVPEKSWGNLTLRAGATYDYSDRDGDSVSPVLEIQSRDGEHSWHISCARVTQVPTYTAIKSNPAGGLFRGNQSLGRESSNQAELGFGDTIAGWTVEAAAFWRRDDSLVDWTFRRGVTARTANPVDIETAGIECVARRSWRNADIVFGYTGLTKSADYRLATVDASFYALNYAKHRITLAATIRLFPGVELRLDNSARWQTPNLLRTVGGDHAFLTSAALAWHPSAWRGIEFTATVDNAWNASFQEIPATPAARRQTMAGIRYVW